MSSIYIYCCQKICRWLSFCRSACGMSWSKSFRNSSKLALDIPPSNMDRSICNQWLLHSASKLTNKQHAVKTLRQTLFQTRTQYNKHVCLEQADKTATHQNAVSRSCLRNRSISSSWRKSTRPARPVACSRNLWVRSFGAYCNIGKLEKQPLFARQCCELVEWRLCSCWGYFWRSLVLLCCRCKMARCH